LFFHQILLENGVIFIIYLWTIDHLCELYHLTSFLTFPWQWRRYFLSYTPLNCLMLYAFRDSFSFQWIVKGVCHKKNISLFQIVDDLFHFRSKYSFHMKTKKITKYRWFLLWNLALVVFPYSLSVIYKSYWNHCYLSIIYSIVFKN
jgi:hypothetical protein